MNPFYLFHSYVLVVFHIEFFVNRNFSKDLTLALLRGVFSSLNCASLSKYLYCLFSYDKETPQNTLQHFIKLMIYHSIMLIIHQGLSKQIKYIMAVDPVIAPCTIHTHNIL